MLAEALHLPGNIQCVIDLNADVWHHRQRFGVSEEQLHGAKALGPPIDKRCFGRSH
ncbi:MAG: hypothetical protein IV107_06575 [Paucibacter sp.]|nr:hypothetical protein [Roseateles sp.]